MARIASALPEGVGAELEGGDRVNLDVGGILQHRPEVSAALGGVTAALLSSGTLPRRLVELVRLRIAFHNQCRSCMSLRYAGAVDDGLTEDLVCSLERPQEAPDLTEPERAALRYADLFATDHLAIDDAVYDDLRRHFDEGQLVELGLHCAVDVGIGRLAATWHAVDHLDEAMRVDGPVAPWSAAGLLAH